MDGGQRARARSLLCLRRSRTVGALGTGENAAGGKEDDLAFGKLLFEFACEALLDFVETLEKGDGYEDDDGLLAMSDLELFGRHEL